MVAFFGNIILTNVILVLKNFVEFILNFNKSIIFHY